MEILGSARKPLRTTAIDERCFTNFYRQAPIGDTLGLQDFEAFATERIKVLRLFETAAFRFAKFSQEYLNEVDRMIPQNLKDCFIRPVRGNIDDSTFAEYERKDTLSHFALRLVFCRKEEIKAWFVNLETDLFHYRLTRESPKTLNEFFANNDLHYARVSPEEYESLREILARSTLVQQEGNTICTEKEFYKIDFLDALKLVRRREVYLSRGWAYVPHSKIITIAVERFREHLSYELVKVAQVMSEASESTRLVPLLNKLAAIAGGQTGKDYSNNDTDYGINLATLDTVAAESFPLCSKNMHDHLRKDHHLKHDARLQYGLFIKGIGISLDDNMKLMRTEFAKHGINEAKFGKDYGYNIRHMYGKEGKRTNYTPPSCTKIITSSAPSGSDQHHGCPFRHFERRLLHQRIKAAGVSEEDCKEIVEMANRTQYTLACTRYFEVTHRAKVKQMPFVETIQHPNQYFEESRRLLHPELVKERPAVFGRKVQVPVGGQGVQTVYRGNGQVNGMDGVESEEKIDEFMEEFATKRQEEEETDQWMATIDIEPTGN